MPEYPGEQHWTTELAASFDKLNAKVKSLEMDLGLTQIALEGKVTLLQSCETALAERDDRLSEAQEALEEQRRVIESLCAGTDCSTPAVVTIARLEMVIEDRDAAIKELRDLVKEAYAEGFEDGSKGSAFIETVENNWPESLTLGQLNKSNGEG